MSKRFNIYDEYREKFYRLPKVFFTNQRYIKLSNDAKMAWAILQDRLELSQKNRWIDDNGDFYFIYTNKKLEEILNCSKNKVTSIKKELTNADLLEQIQRGLNKANILYLNKPEVTDEDIYAIDNSEKKESDPSADKESQNKGLRNPKIRDSKLPKIGSQESHNMSPNDTDLSDTDLSDIDEEEYIISKIENNIFYKSLMIFLASKNVSKDLILRIIKECIKQKLYEFRVIDFKKQFEYMAKEIEYGVTYGAFEVYFVNGLKDRVEQAFISKEHMEQEKQKQEEKVHKRDTSIYYNWLVEDGTQQSI
jgi:hypothetical protein